MSHATIRPLEGRGPSTRPSRARTVPDRPGSPRVGLRPRPPPEPTPAVACARRRLAEGYYDSDEMFSCALDRLLDHAAARFGARPTG